MLDTLMCSSTPRDRRNLRQVLLVVFGWAVCFVAATFLIKKEVVAGPLAWGVAAIPILLGVGVILAYGRLIRDADELQRRIHLTGIAFAFGSSWLFLSGYPILARLGAPALEPGIDGVVMAVAYSIGVVASASRYR